MKKFVPHILRRIHILRFDFLIDRVSTLPPQSSLTDGNVALFESGGVKKWASFKCPGGCGIVISLSL